jgi:hypothetical protein
MIAFTQAETATSRRFPSPVDELHDESRLVPVGLGVDDAGGLCPLCQGRAGERIRLDGHHDDVLAGLDGAKRVVDADDRIAGRLHDHVDVVIEELRGVRHYRGRAIRESGCDIRGDLICRPADESERALGTRDIDVGDRDDVDTGDVARLRQVHRAESPGPDEADPDRTTFGLACNEQFVEVHCLVPVCDLARKSGERLLRHAEWYRLHFCTTNVLPVSIPGLVAGLERSAGYHEQMMRRSRCGKLPRFAT